MSRHLHGYDPEIRPKLTEFELVERDMCERSLKDFIRVFWSEVEGTEFIPGWHIDAICEHLEAVTRCEIRKLLINGPPRSSKSRPVSIFWQPWEWISAPHRTWLTAGVTQRLAVEFNHSSRQLMRCEKYQRYWGHLFQFDDSHDLKTEFLNNLGGRRLAVGANTKFIGAGGERKILDDPHMPGDSAEMMLAMGTWYFKTWRTRTNNPRIACEVLNMQRLSVYDLSAQVLESENDWEKLIFPSRFNPAKRIITSIGFTDPRVEEGELLWPGYVGEKEEIALRKSLKESADAQMDQDPVNDADTLYKTDNLNNFYSRLIYNRDLDVVATSLDTAQKSTTTSDFSACGTFLKKGGRFFFIGGFAKRLEFGDLLTEYNNELTLWTNRGIKFYKHLIEDSTVGPALANLAEKKFPRIELVKAIRNKLARFKSVVPVYESNRLWFPTPGAVIVIDGTEYDIDSGAVEEWLKQTRQVPGGKNDDCPDSTAQVVEALEGISFLDLDDGDDEYDEEDRFFRID